MAKITLLKYIIFIHSCCILPAELSPALPEWRACPICPWRAVISACRDADEELSVADPRDVLTDRLAAANDRGPAPPHRPVITFAAPPSAVIRPFNFAQGSQGRCKPASNWLLSIRVWPVSFVTPLT